MEPLDERYLTWLYGQVGHIKIRSRSRSYWELFRILYQTEFEWSVYNDDNRVEDGRDLRYEFFEAEGLEDDNPEWSGLGCSVLEMMVGLTRRLAFEAEGQPRTWFWILIENLGLSAYSDSNMHRQAEDDIRHILDVLIDRRYSTNGQGGLFPLKNPQRDQRKVEIWYQLSAYVLELD